MSEPRMIRLLRPDSLSPRRRALAIEAASQIEGVMALALSADSSLDSNLRESVGRSLEIRSQQLAGIVVGALSGQDDDDEVSEWELAVFGRVQEPPEQPD